MSKNMVNKNINVMLVMFTVLGCGVGATKIHAAAALGGVIEQRCRRAIDDARNSRNALRALPVRQVTSVVVHEGQEAEDCFICYNDPVEIRLGCGHEMCRSCLHYMIMENCREGDIVGLRCPKAGCNSAFAYDVVEADDRFIFGENQQLFGCYWDLILRLAMRDNPLFRACPNACDWGILLNEGDAERAQEVACQAAQCRVQNFRFCSGCSEAAHPERDYCLGG